MNPNDFWEWVMDDNQYMFECLDGSYVSLPQYFHLVYGKDN